MKEKDNDFFHDYQFLHSKLTQRFENYKLIQDRILSEEYSHVLLFRIIFMYFLHSHRIIFYKNIEEQNAILYSPTEFFIQNHIKQAQLFLFSLWFKTEKQINCKFFDWSLFNPVENIENKRSQFNNSNIDVPNELWYQIFSRFMKYQWKIIIYQRCSTSNNAIIPQDIINTYEKFCEKKNTGTVYTPNIITEYMCKSSLENYFMNRLFLKSKNTSIKYNSIIGDLIYRQDNREERISLIETFFYEILLPLKICDNACGGGNFLIEMYKKLSEYFLICLKVLPNINIEKITNLPYPPNIKGIDQASFWHLYILTQILYGVDISSTAILLTKMQLILYFILYDFLESSFLIQDIDTHIQWGNSILGFIKPPDSSIIRNNNSQSWDTALLYDINTANQESELLNMQTLLSLKPFHWSLVFRDVYIQRGFDIIISNPPYIKEYMNRNAFLGIHNSPYYQGKMDIWYLFLCRGIDLLKEEGILAYIAQNNWVTSTGASKLRKKIITECQILEYLDFNEHKIFPNAEIQTMITILRKTTIPVKYYAKYSLLLPNQVSEHNLVNFLMGDTSIDFLRYVAYFDRSEFQLHQNERFFPAIRFLTTESHAIFSRIIHLPHLIYLGKFAPSHNVIETDMLNEISNGTDPHQYCVTKLHQQKLGSQIPVGTGIFVLSDAEKAAIPFNAKELVDIVKPFYIAEQCGRFYVNAKNRFWILYTPSNMNKHIHEYPNVKSHLDRFIPILTSDFKPYGLHRSRNPALFQGARLFSVRKCKRPTICYVDFDAVVGQSFNIIKTSRIDLKYLVGVLNSSFAYYWFYHFGKRQGKLLQIDEIPLMEFPIVIPSDHEKEQIIHLVDQILTNHTPEAIEKYAPQIDQLVFKLYQCTDTEIQSISTFLSSL